MNSTSARVGSIPGRINSALHRLSQCHWSLTPLIYYPRDPFGVVGGRIDSGLRPSGLRPVAALRRRPNAKGVCRTFGSNPAGRAVALRLGSMVAAGSMCLLYGWGGRIRTCECWDQNPVPCRLATPQSICRVRLNSSALATRLRPVPRFPPNCVAVVAGPPWLLLPY